MLKYLHAISGRIVLVSIAPISFQTSPNDIFLPAEGKYPLLVFL